MQVEARVDGSWSRAVAGFESLLGQGRARSEAGAADLALETKWEVVLFTGRGQVGIHDALVLNVLSLRHLGGGEVQGGGWKGGLELQGEVRVGRGDVAGRYLQLMLGTETLRVDAVSKGQCVD